NQIARCPAEPSKILTILSFYHILSDGKMFFMTPIWTPTAETWRVMFKATAVKRDFAKQLLNSMTSAELRLWAELSKENVGPLVRPICPWRPQVVIKGWIVDFYNNYRHI